MAPALQIPLDHPTGMNPGIITDHMNLAVAHEMAAQVVKMTYEQSGGAALVGEPLSHDHRSRAPVERARQVAFLVGAGRGDLRLLATPQPHGADLGIGVDLDFVLEDCN